MYMYAYMYVHACGYRDAVYMLTSADIDSGQYSIRDIVLATVGTATVLPGNQTGVK